MIANVQPIANVLSIPVDGQRFAQQDVDTHQGNEFFGEVVGPVVIRAIGDQGGDVISMEVGTGEVIAARFGRRVGTVGRVRRGF